jgi:hypothetical protein
LSQQPQYIRIPGLLNGDADTSREHPIHRVILEKCPKAAQSVSSIPLTDIRARGYSAMIATSHSTEETS